MKTSWKNASGTAVVTQPTTITLDLPCEKCVDPSGDLMLLTTINWGAVIAAAIQLILALMTGNSTGIASAIQALISAIMG